jgi:hypothetical protein
MAMLFAWEDDPTIGTKLLCWTRWERYAASSSETTDGKAEFAFDQVNAFAESDRDREQTRKQKGLKEEIHICMIMRLPGRVQSSTSYRNKAVI